MVYIAGIGVLAILVYLGVRALMDEVNDLDNSIYNWEDED